MTVAWDFLTQGDIIAAVISVFSTRFDPVPALFYAVVLAIGLSIVYIKTENFGTVGVVGLLVASFTITVLPVEVHLIAWVLLSLSIVVILFKAVVK